MTEPVILGLTPAILVGVITALANLLRTWGIGITQEQVDSINGAVPQIMLVLVVVGAWFGRSKVTPVAAPTLPQGTTVTVETPAGQANTTTTV